MAVGQGPAPTPLKPLVGAEATAGAPAECVALCCGLPPRCCASAPAARMRVVDGSESARRLGEEMSLAALRPAGPTRQRAAELFRRFLRDGHGSGQRLGPRAVEALLRELNGGYRPRNWVLQFVGRLTACRPERGASEEELLDALRALEIYRMYRADLEALLELRSCSASDALGVAEAGALLSELAGRRLRSEEAAKLESIAGEEGGALERHVFGAVAASLAWGWARPEKVFDSLAFMEKGTRSCSFGWGSAPATTVHTVNVLRL